MSNSRYLSAYYFMGQDLCMVRQHTRNDMEWLVAHGFDAINIGIHSEQYRQPRGAGLIIEEAKRVGLEVIAIPSRWCGLIAGWPVLTGHFAASRPDLWMLNAEGKPLLKNFCGPMCSVHHPDVKQNMIENTEKMLCTWDLDGIMWDELKSLHETDYHPAAIEKFGKAASGMDQIQASLDIFAACNRAARAIKPELRICSFLYAQLEEEFIKPWAATEGFDDIGLDGKVARTEDFNLKPDSNKVLIEHAPKFIKAAIENNKRSFALIETQDFDVAHARVTMKRLPEFLKFPLDHIAVYYHPLVKEPEAEITAQIAPLLCEWRNG